MTYKEIQKYYKNKYNGSIKTCWIADIKRQLGLPTRKAYNRKNEDFVLFPCPDGQINKRLKIIIKANNK